MISSIVDAARRVAGAAGDAAEGARDLATDVGSRTIDFVEERISGLKSILSDELQRAHGFAEEIVERAMAQVERLAEPIGTVLQFLGRQVDHYMAMGGRILSGLLARVHSVGLIFDRIWASAEHLVGRIEQAAAALHARVQGIAQRVRQHPLVQATLHAIQRLREYRREIRALIHIPVDTARTVVRSLKDRAIYRQGQIILLGQSLTRAVIGFQGEVLRRLHGLPSLVISQMARFRAWLSERARAFLSIRSPDELYAYLLQTRAQIQSEVQAIRQYLVGIVQEAMVYVQTKIREITTFVQGVIQEDLRLITDLADYVVSEANDYVFRLTRLLQSAQRDADLAIDFAREMAERMRVNLLRQIRENPIVRAAETVELERLLQGLAEYIQQGSGMGSPAAAGAGAGAGTAGSGLGSGRAPLRPPRRPSTEPGPTHEENPWYEPIESETPSSQSSGAGDPAPSGERRSQDRTFSTEAPPEGDVLHRSASRADRSQTPRDVVPPPPIISAPAGQVPRIVNEGRDEANAIPEPTAADTQYDDGQLTGPFYPRNYRGRPFPGPDAAIRSRQVALFVNGMLTTGIDHARGARALAERVQRPVVGIFNATEGAVTDLLQCVTDKIGVLGAGRLNPATRTLAEVIRATGGQGTTAPPLPIYAHSQGSIILSEAMRQARGAQVDLSHLEVTTMGNAAWTMPEGARSYRHLTFRSDSVSTAVGSQGVLGAAFGLASPLLRRLGFRSTSEDTYSLEHQGTGIRPHNIVAPEAYTSERDLSPRAPGTPGPTVQPDYISSLPQFLAQESRWRQIRRHAGVLQPVLDQGAMVTTAMRSTGAMAEAWAGELISGVGSFARRRLGGSLRAPDPMPRILGPASMLARNPRSGSPGSPTPPPQPAPTPAPTPPANPTLRPVPIRNRTVSPGPRPTPGATAGSGMRQGLGWLSQVEALAQRFMGMTVGGPVTPPRATLPPSTPTVAVRGAAPTPGVTPGPTPTPAGAVVQRSGSGAAPQGNAAALRENLLSEGGPGNPVPASVAMELGPYVQFDPRRARIHTGPAAARAAREMGAEAFTIGRDIFFGEGRFQPERPEGKSLLGHELTHVAQQSGALGPRVQRLGGPASDQAEQQAMRVGSRIRTDFAHRPGLAVENLEMTFADRRGEPVVEPLVERITRLAPEVLAVAESRLTAVRPETARERLDRLELDIFLLEQPDYADDEIVQIWSHQLVDQILLTLDAQPSAPQPPIPTEPVVQTFRYNRIRVNSQPGVAVTRREVQAIIDPLPEESEASVMRRAAEMVVTVLVGRIYGDAFNSAVNQLLSTFTLREGGTHDYDWRVRKIYIWKNLDRQGQADFRAAWALIQANQEIMAGITVPDPAQQPGEQSAPSRPQTAQSAESQPRTPSTGNPGEENREGVRLSEKFMFLDRFERRCRAVAAQKMDRALELLDQMRNYYVGRGSTGAQNRLQTVARAIQNMRIEIRGMRRELFNLRGDLVNYPSRGLNMQEGIARANALEERINNRQRQFDRFLRDARAQYTVLNGWGDDTPPWSALAEGGAAEHEALTEMFDQKARDIRRVKNEIVSGEQSVWYIPSLIELTKQDMGIDDGSMQAFWIRMEVGSRWLSRAVRSIAIAIFSVCLAIVATVATGGVALVAAGGALAVGAAQTAQDVIDYRFERSMARTHFDRQQALSQVEPSAFWLAVGIVGNFLDLAEFLSIAARLARPINAAMDAARQAGRVLDAAEQARLLTQVESLARQEAESLQAAGRLEGSVDDFVRNAREAAERHLRGDAPRPGTDAAEAAARSQGTTPPEAPRAPGERDALPPPAPETPQPSGRPQGRSPTAGPDEPTLVIPASEVPTQVVPAHSAPTPVIPPSEMPTPVLTGPGAPTVPMPVPRTPLAGDALAQSPRELQELIVRELRAPAPGQSAFRSYATQAEYEAAYRAVGGTNSPPLGFYVDGVMHLPPGASTITAVHEALHGMTTNSRARSIWGSFAEEGYVEMMARRVAGPTAERVYEVNQRFVRALMDSVGEQIVTEAFLHGQWATLRRALEVRLGSAQAADDFIRRVRALNPASPDPLESIRLIDRLESAGPPRATMPDPASTRPTPVMDPQRQADLADETRPTVVNPPTTPPGPPTPPTTPPGTTVPNTPAGTTPQGTTVPRDTLPDGTTVPRTTTQDPALADTVVPPQTVASPPRGSAPTQAAAGPPAPPVQPPRPTGTSDTVDLANAPTLTRDPNAPPPVPPSAPAGGGRGTGPGGGPRRPHDFAYHEQPPPNIPIDPATVQPPPRPVPTEVPRTAYQIERRPSSGVSAENNFFLTAQQEVRDSAGNVIMQPGQQYLFKAENPSLQSGIDYLTGAGGHVYNQPARRATAASDIADELGVAAPNTELVTFNGVQGTLQQVVRPAAGNRMMSVQELAQHNPAAYRRITQSPEYRRAYDQVEAFDYVINNVDRGVNRGNYMIEVGPNDEFVRLVPIDHDFTLGPVRDRSRYVMTPGSEPGRGTMPTSGPVVEAFTSGLPETYTRAMVERMRRMAADEARIRAQLARNLSQQEIDGVFHRLRQVLADVDARPQAIID